MPTQLPSGRWRPRIRHPRTGKQLNPAAVIGGPETYATPEAATGAEDRARELLRQNARLGVTVAEWASEWTTSPLWARPAESTNLHNAERIRGFVTAHGHRPMCSIGDEIVAAWLRGGRNRSTVPALRAFFHDAMSAAAGRLVDRNPFANLRLPGSRGRRDRQPPAQAKAAELVALADRLTPPRSPPTSTPRCMKGCGRASSTRSRGRRWTCRRGRSWSSGSGTPRLGSSRCPSTGWCARSR